MKNLLIAAACGLMIAFISPVYAEGDRVQSPCKGLDDGSFKCASFLAKETFFDLASDSAFQSQAASACIEVLVSQAGKGVGGSQRFISGDVFLDVSLTEGVAQCVGGNVDGKYEGGK